MNVSLIDGQSFSFSELQELGKRKERKTVYNKHKYESLFVRYFSNDTVIVEIDDNGIKNNITIKR